MVSRLANQDFTVHVGYDNHDFVCYPVFSNFNELLSEKISFKVLSVRSSADCTDPIERELLVSTIELVWVLGSFLKDDEISSVDLFVSLQHHSDYIRDPVRGSKHTKGKRSIMRCIRVDRSSPFNEAANWYSYLTEVRF